MQTTALKTFATSARTELIREVNARITAVLSQGSPERVENPKAVSALEEAVATGGGVDCGKTHVVDQVAYTWFNRIIALRFMDANGYTGIGVVSPAADQVGQPEVLAAAKRGQIDQDVVSRHATLTNITGLLDGTRQPRHGVDAQAEAYVLLLTAYCHFWNGTMPFMFEREVDFTELLIPANLLAEDSVLNRSVQVLTTEVCQDVEVIGWLYQFYIADRKGEVFAGFKKNKKAGANEIPAATQLFTPHWIVRYLVENSVGRLWMLNRPSSMLVNQMDFYIAPVDQETDFMKIAKPEELTVIDPACGSGHMLTYAFDLLYSIYEEEGFAPSEIPGLILANNLYGTEIDPRAGSLAAFALTMKAVAKRKLFLKNPVVPNICVLNPITFSLDELDYLVTNDDVHHTEAAFWNQFADAETFGSLIQPDADLTVRLVRHLKTVDDDGDMFKADVINRAACVEVQAEYLTSRYSVVVTNPPYMGTRNMNETLRAFAESSYPITAGDLCTMFIERSLALASPNGLAALVASESWLFNSTYVAFREKLAHRAPPITTACIDKSAFGVRLNTAATVFQCSGRPSYSQFFRVSQELLSRGPIASLPPSDAEVYVVKVQSFAHVPGGALVFDMPAPLLKLYGKSDILGEVHDARQGLATGNNNRFLRHWWEVSRSRTAYGLKSRAEAQRSGCLWFPYNKGGTAVPWWGNQDHVIAFDDENFESLSKLGNKLPSRSRYFKSSITWSNIGSSGARFRYLPDGFVFDVSGMSLFIDDAGKSLDALGYLNSQTARQGLDVLAPTLNYQVGDVARLPLVSGEEDRDRVSELIQLSRAEWAESETAHEFEMNPLVGTHERSMATAAETVIADREGRSRRIESLEVASNEYWVGQIAELSGYESASFPTFAARQPALRLVANDVSDLVSYAVGCMFGRFCLDETGLILADQGSTMQDYFAKVPTPKFTPDADNVIPIVDGNWFPDDIVEQFRQYLRAAFGEQHFNENLGFVNESLGVSDIRDYFVKSFYKDHVHRYKKRPIYWLFSSPKGSFNALIYMHRYTPSTVSTVLAYLREYVTKLESSLQQAERGQNAKEADRLRKMLIELNEYEHDTLYPKASENVAIELDDGVKANYPKLGPALKKIAGLEASDG